MNVAQLRDALVKGGYDSRNYRVMEAPDESTWCIRKQGKSWLVFYFERGSRWQLQRFATESAACEYFLNRVGHG
jgi:hypothetical protein